MNFSFSSFSRRQLIWGGVLGATALVALAIVLLFSLFTGAPEEKSETQVAETALVHVFERDITSFREELKNPFYGILRPFQPTKDSTRPRKANPFVR